MSQIELTDQHDSDAKSTQDRRCQSFDPDPDLIAELAREIRKGWSLDERARRRADMELADITDAAEGFVWSVRRRTIS